MNNLYLLTAGGTVIYLPSGWIEETLDITEASIEAFNGITCRAWIGNDPVPAGGDTEFINYHQEIALHDLVAATPISQAQAEAICPHLFAFLNRMDKA